MSRLARNTSCTAAAVLAVLVCDAATSAVDRADGRPRRSCPNAHARPGKASPKQLARASRCLVNRVRRRHGLRPLRVRRRLSVAARRHARAMVRGGFFSHFSRSGASFVDRIARAGYLRRARSWLLGENLAWGAGRRAKPAAVVRAWMRSAAHRRTMLNPRFREIGVGVAAGAPGRRRRGAAIYAHDFGLVVRQAPRRRFRPSARWTRPRRGT